MCTKSASHEQNLFVDWREMCFTGLYFSQQYKVTLKLFQTEALCSSQTLKRKALSVACVMQCSIEPGEFNNLEKFTPALKDQHYFFFTTKQKQSEVAASQAYTVKMETAGVEMILWKNNSDFSVLFECVINDVQCKTCLINVLKRIFLVSKKKSK